MSPAPASRSISQFNYSFPKRKTYQNTDGRKVDQCLLQPNLFAYVPEILQVYIISVEFEISQIGSFF